MTETNTQQKIILGQSKSQVILQLGEPLKKSIVEGREIFRYGANLDLNADYYYFENDKLVLKSISHNKDSVIFSSYVNQYGQPDKSFYRYDSKNNDPETVHIWLENGLELITARPNFSAKVLRERIFNPVAFDLYKTTWGKSYNVESVAVIKDMAINLGEVGIEKEIRSTPVASTPAADIRESQNQFSPILIAIPLIILLLTIVLFFLNKFNKKTKTSVQIKTDSNVVPPNPPIV
ncbi:hypothetical protein KJZ63_02565 [Patescibacteria group bacterium]|nr:hypothetical protein [Patescibacteria group bacterium]